MAAYLAQHVRPTLRTAKAVERRLRKNVLAVIGNVPLGELHRRDINRVSADPCPRSPRRGGEGIRGMRAFLGWAVSRGDLDFNPADGVKKPEGSQARERVLSDAEISTLWNGLDEALPRSPVVRDVIRLCLLTGQRVGEVAGIGLEELDAKKRLWTIPAARSKNKHAHAVPLTDQSLALAELMAAAAKMPTHAVDKIVRRAQEHFGLAHWTMHDLRRTVVTRMAELGISPIVLAHVVNHRSVSKAGVTLGVYSQYTYEKEKREALELWAKRLDAIVGEGAAGCCPFGGAANAGG